MQLEFSKYATVNVKLCYALEIMTLTSTNSNCVYVELRFFRIMTAFLFICTYSSTVNILSASRVFCPRNKSEKIFSGATQCSSSDISEIPQQYVVSTANIFP